ncbi:AcrR family transcriptional regulator [Saccharothrix tamanrassetensis]|uniref:AcrR family transcriptional regulator n=1 Tax=Saccharothrix tamanrassetensis TaxID=1051531 RepID=A0A841CE08_9PSEU|nr:TetR family transcriptional regulator [Saccharothrix tamanrassetensis]MBB5956772.1 AcrR family transcriptional regulator [Saccharothrix tamanrassetensis]
MAPEGLTTPERIVAAAVRLFAAKGFDATTVQEVVEAASVTKGALYHYFGSKDDLLFEIYRSLIGRQTADLDRIIAQGADPATTVRRIMVSLVATTADSVDETAVFVREMHRLDAERMAAFRAERRRYHEAFRAVVEKAQAEGQFSARVPADTAVLIALGVVNQLPTWYRPDGAKPPEQPADEIADFVLAGLRP